MANTTPGTMFQERWVEADGFRIRFMQAGDGPPLVHLHGSAGLQLTPAHDLLSQSFRVIVLEMPGFGASPRNSRTQNMPQMAATMAAAATAIGLDRFHLMGTSFGATVALWLAANHSALVRTLVLEAPAAIRPKTMQPVSGTPQQIAGRLYAHPERMPPLPATDPGPAVQTLILLRRLRGSSRDPALEDRLLQVATPTLVVFGTRDSVIPPDTGRLYKTLMPNANLVFLYDAGHAAAAERPEAFAEIVSDFLQHGDAFLISRGKTLIFP
ncbi:alpha/beta fold hydrolase [Rhodopila sp.]|uniref:alpha/beta fold hydrolase n=1 Tax=Rhodopila sp. TaxID=2480087 RepID=UPI003D0F3A58